MAGTDTDVHVSSLIACFLASWCVVFRCSLIVFPCMFHYLLGFMASVIFSCLAWILSSSLSLSGYNADSSLLCNASNCLVHYLRAVHGRELIPKNYGRNGQAAVCPHGLLVSPCVQVHVRFCARTFSPGAALQRPFVPGFISFSCIYIAFLKSSSPFLRNLVPACLSF